ncbi:uncharacterized protein UTRI_06025_B [Ustilago trichophora]|uniref:RRM domain-containing protein n=1 Tax=Ustilago trichophora TaxID=86804 RepID=A0A5C3EN95_9BASI|nr:uncharacterized protein UTRI_06025_B [Ustilago trichophora]
MSQKRRAKAKGKGPEVLFDEKARAEYLTGFRKRKQERKQAGREYLAKKAKEEQLAARKELRDARKEKAAENVREQRKAFGLEAEGESDLDAANASDEDQQIDLDSVAEQDAVPQIQEEEYDSDEHHTHVVVESFDPEQQAFEKATATAANAPARKSKADGASSAAPSSVEILPPSSRRVNKAKANASQGEEKSDAHQEENVSQKRLHISGLTASFSQEDLIRRFSTFGTVIALDGLGKRDALGQFRPYAYLTLQAPSQQIKRCMNLLSGSVWKGATLRIGEAKPDYQERLSLEKEKRRQQEEENANNPKKPKRLPSGMGFQSYNMEPVDQDAVKNGLAWGWKRTPAGHLVRPLRMRPSHPLPKPSHASTLERIHAGTAEEGEEDQGQSSRRRARVNPRPPTKAHRITIDPTRYGAIHLSGPLLESLAVETGSSTAAFDVSSLGSGEWHCEEIDDEEEAAEDKTHRLVRWQYVAKDGKVLHEEFTKIPIRVVTKAHASSSSLTGNAVNDTAEDVMAQLDFDRYSIAGSDDDLFSGFTSALTPAKAPVEPKRPTISKAAPAAVDDVVDTADIDDLFASLPASSVPTTGINDLFSDLPSTPTPAPQPKRTKVEKPAPTPTPSKKVKGTFIPGLDPEEEDLANFSDGYDEGAAAGPMRDTRQAMNAEEERNKTLALLGEMFGSGSDDEAPASGVADVEAEEAHTASESSSDSSSDSDSEPEAAEEAEVVAESSSSRESLSSSSESESEAADEEIAGVEVDVEAEPAVARAATEIEEDEEDVIMEKAPKSAVEAVAAPTDAKSRRAAFLSSLSDPASSKTKAKDGSYVPIARFDPGTLATTASPEAVAAATPASADSASTSSNTVSQTTNAVQAAEDAQGTKVSLSTLKEMFKPQDRPSSGVTAGFSLGLGADVDAAGGDTGGGFSLMDSLGLEFELEEEEEEEPELQPAFAPASYSNVGFTRFQQSAVPAMQEEERQQKKLGRFFPSSSSSSSWNGGDSQGSVQRWLKPRSEEEKEKDWAKYKEELTKVIKKRHREAARKHKRNFKSMPQQNAAGASVGGGGGGGGGALATVSRG